MNNTQIAQPAAAGQTPEVQPGTYSPVSFTFFDSMGVLFLGVLSILLMIQVFRLDRQLRR